MRVTLSSDPNITVLMYHFYTQERNNKKRPAFFVQTVKTGYNQRTSKVPCGATNTQGVTKPSRRLGMSDHTPNKQQFKTCGNGENCLHPDGPHLPLSEYYKGTRWLCRPCMRQYRKEHHERNREYDNERSREYAKKNRHRYELYRNNYYIRKAAVVKESYSVHDIDIIYKRQQGRCWWCQEFVGLKFEIDHRIPISRGGKDDVSNIVIACGTCNRSKGDKLPHEWCGRLL